MVSVKIDGTMNPWVPPVSVVPAASLASGVVNDRVTITKGVMGASVGTLLTDGTALPLSPGPVFADCMRNAAEGTKGFREAIFCLIDQVVYLGWGIGKCHLLR